MPKGLPFSPNEDARIAELAAQGMCVAEIAHTLKRTNQGVGYRAYKLSIAIRKNPPVRKFTAEETECLINMAHAGHTKQAIALALNRSVDGIRNKVQRLNIPFDGRRHAKSDLRYRLEPYMVAALDKLAKSKGYSVSRMMRMVSMRMVGDADFAARAFGPIDALRLPKAERNADPLPVIEEECRPHALSAAATPPVIIMSPELLGSMQLMQSALLATMH
jgi:hypothetical protein